MFSSPEKMLGIARARYRITQGLNYLRPRDASDIDARLSDLLRPCEYSLVRRLSPADRAHHLDVHDRLVRSGCTDADVLTAALLHDVGKCDGAARVGLVHRTLAVLLDASAPALLRSLSSASGPRWRRALYLVEAHADVGAHFAREAGCSETVCWLIAHHHDRQVTDERLLWLQRADDGVET